MRPSNSIYASAARPAPRSGERLRGRVDLVVVAAGGEEGELAHIIGGGAGGLVRQKNKTVLDRRLGMEAHDLVGRQTAGIDPFRSLPISPATGGEHQKATVCTIGGMRHDQPF